MRFLPESQTPVLPSPKPILLCPLLPLARLDWRLQGLHLSDPNSEPRLAEQPDMVKLPE
jgi:hypothetical protein